MAKITDITKLPAEQGKITFILMQCEPETILVKSNKYEVDGMKEFWCLIFQRSKEHGLKATLHFSYVMTWCINASEFQLGTEFLYVKNVVCRVWSWSFQSSTYCQVKLDTFLSNIWTINNTGKAVLFTHLSLYFISLRRLSPEKCVFRVLKIPWETPFFWAPVPPHCQEKVFFLQINLQYLAVRTKKPTLSPKDGTTI